MKRDWWHQEFRTLLTLGEGTTAGGWSSCRERCWASQLARQINGVLASSCSGLSLATKALEQDIPPWRDESTLQE